VNFLSVSIPATL